MESAHAVVVAMSGSLRCCILAVLLFAALATVQAQAQSRPDPKALAAAEMTASEKAAAAHDHRAAFEHALGAWQLDESNPAYLWAAATQALLAGLEDKAEPLFKQWQSLLSRDTGLDLKAREHLADIVKRRAGAKAAQAEAASRAGDHGAARRLFLEAAALDPGEPEHLYGAGLEAMAMRDEVAATRLLTDYLNVAAPDAANRAKATKQLAELGAGPPAPRESTAAPDDPWTRQQLWGAGVAGAGLVLTAAGVWALVQSAQAADDLVAFQTAPVTAGAEKSLAQQREIESRQQNYTVGGWTAGGIGVAALAAGAWLYWTGDAPKVAMAVLPLGIPGDSGVMVSLVW